MNGQSAIESAQSRRRFARIVLPMKDGLFQAVSECECQRSVVFVNVLYFMNFGACWLPSLISLTGWPEVS